MLSSATFGAAWRRWAAKPSWTPAPPRRATSRRPVPPGHVPPARPAGPRPAGPSRRATSRRPVPPGHVPPARPAGPRSAGPARSRRFCYKSRVKTQDKYYKIIPAASGRAPPNRHNRHNRHTHHTRHTHPPPPPPPPWTHRNARSRPPRPPDDHTLLRPEARAGPPPGRLVAPTASPDHIALRRLSSPSFLSARLAIPRVSASATVNRTAPFGLTVAGV